MIAYLTVWEIGFCWLGMTSISNHLNSISRKKEMWRDFLLGVLSAKLKNRRHTGSSMDGTLCMNVDLSKDNRVNDPVIREIFIKLQRRNTVDQLRCHHLLPSSTVLLATQPSSLARYDWHCSRMMIRTARLVWTDRLNNLTTPSWPDSRKASQSRIEISCVVPDSSPGSWSESHGKSAQHAGESRWTMRDC